MACYKNLEYLDYQNIIQKLNTLDPNSNKAKLINSAKLEICKCNSEPEYDIVVNSDYDDDNMDIDFSNDNTTQLNNSSVASCSLLDIIYGNILIVEFTIHHPYLRLTGYEYDNDAFLITRSKLEKYTGPINNLVETVEYDLPNEIIPEYTISDHLTTKTGFNNSLFVKDDKFKGTMFTACIQSCITNDIMNWLSNILDD